MIEPRIYRAAFLPAVLALVLLAFSLESRPPAQPQGLAADILFDGQRAGADMREIARVAPDRRPGTIGNERIARRVARDLASAGFSTELDSFTAEDTRMTNVIARRGGGSTNPVVVVAARDADSVPDVASSAADTAALVELARVFQGKVANKTLLLASVDGSTMGDAGVRRLAEQLGEGPEPDAVIVLSHLAVERPEGSLLIAWSNDASRGGIGLERTARNSLRQELGGLGEDESAPGQLLRLAFPLGLGGQGPLLAEGLDAIRISGSGELPPKGADGPDDVDLERYEQLGKGALRTVFAIEEGERPEHGPDAYIIFAGQVLPDWALWFFTFCLIVPALVASVDAFARLRRRREPVSPYWTWLGAGILPFVLAYGLGEFLVLVGQAPDPPRGPPPVADAEVTGETIGALLATGGVVALGLLLTRTRVLRRPGWPPSAAASGAGVVSALTLSFAVLLVWLVNFFAAFLLVPALHLWMLVALTPVPRRGAAVLTAVGALPLAIVALMYLDRLGLGPLEGCWYAFQLVTGGHTSVVATLLACVIAGVGVSVISIAARHPREGERSERRRATHLAEAEPQPIFGPGGHAGPGMIGGPTGGRRR